MKRGFPVKSLQSKPEYSIGKPEHFSDWKFYPKGKRLMTTIKRDFHMEDVTFIFIDGNLNECFTLGDIVLLETTAKRISWPLGKVVKLIKGKDGIVRLVKVRTKQGDLLRPIQRLYPLEVSSPNDRELRKRIEDTVICDEGKGHNPSDSSSPVPVFQEATSPVPVSPEELLPTSQSRRINRYGRTLRAPHRLDL
ncbi:hypothetical protein HNY73_013696 [Argiope bruennichi]|uniref:DUF5641 domain-containing protein n=1 Tax=Argiope bruennichi TaxID=94029 RepID=A0A8T0F126_ARGBR|nr:hypothetical protein HNY73_013696 [Argiope bruennichi]